VSKIRVLVADDSAFARKVVRQILERADDIEVLDIARDGLEAIEKVAALDPDVLTLDLMMPGLDGVGVLQALPKEGRTRVVVVSSSNAESDLGIAALEAGAVDLVEKPTALATQQMYEMNERLIGAVRTAAGARAPASVAALARRAAKVEASARTGSNTELLVIGASTGGPQALSLLLAALPGDMPVPTAIVVHMPPGYTESLARRLDQLSQLTVLEAHEGQVLLPGMAVIARAGAHLRLRREEGRMISGLDFRRTPGELHQPSVDALFKSAADVSEGRVVGVVLTGMGEDGLLGARAIVDRGGRVITESETSAVVYGMPRAVSDAGLSDASAPLANLVPLILARL
jgi:two-component system, chemotaxis family, protein-glutamate methylesterase/glutaminase